MRKINGNSTIERSYRFCVANCQYRQYRHAKKRDKPTYKKRTSQQKRNKQAKKEQAKNELQIKMVVRTSAGWKVKLQLGGGSCEMQLTRG